MSERHSAALRPRGKSSQSNVLSASKDLDSRDESNYNYRSLADAGTAVREKVAHALTVAWHEIPEWMQDNEYIVTGYRRVQNSLRGCIVSIFTHLHNETVNIHTHLAGALLFLFFLIFVNGTHMAEYTTSSWHDAAVFIIFLSTAVLCLMASTAYHAMICHSQRVKERCNAFDYVGIVVLIVGSFYPALYYGFFCDTKSQVFWMSVLTTAGLGAAYVVLSPEYAKPSYRAARTGVFVGLGVSAVLPVAQMLYQNGLKVLLARGLDYLLISAVLYIGGALIYANRVPERFAPGKFDYFFASHQIFHVCVVLAALAHYASISVAFRYWHSSENGCRIPM